MATDPDQTPPVEPVAQPGVPADTPATPEKEKKQPASAKKEKHRQDKPKHPYRPEDFPNVPEALRQGWQSAVEDDVAQSVVPEHTYLEWRIFHRATFSEWRTRKDVTDDVIPPDYRRTPTLFDDAMDHCCKALDNNRIRDQIVPHLLRRKTTVLDRPPPPDKPYFRNDIQQALYMLYEAEVLRRVENYVRSRSIDPGEEDPYRYDALQSLRNKANMEYKQEHEEKWVWLMRKGVRGRLTARSSRLVEKHTPEGAEEPVRKTSLNEEFDDDNSQDRAAVFASVEDTHIQKMQSADAMLRVLKLVEEMEKKKKPGSETRTTYSEREILVFRKYCENIAGGGEKNNSELAEEIGITPTNFGATLSNAARKIREDTWLSREFTRLLADNEDSKRRY